MSEVQPVVLEGKEYGRERVTDCGGSRALSGWVEGMDGPVWTVTKTSRTVNAGTSRTRDCDARAI